MRVFTYSDARQRFAELLDLADREPVLIRRRDGSSFILRKEEPMARSPLDVEGIASGVSRKEILDAVYSVRESSIGKEERR
jgi:hypothetical protein